MIDNRAEFCWSFVRKAGRSAIFCAPMGILPLPEVIHSCEAQCAGEEFYNQSPAALITDGLHPSQAELEIDKI
jgi:hypothetical protein